MKKIILSVVVTAFAISVYAGGSECAKQAAAAGSCSAKTKVVAEAKGDCASACTKTQASAVKSDCASECSKTKASATKGDCQMECGKTKASATKGECTKASAAKSGCCGAAKTPARLQSPKAAA